MLFDVLEPLRVLCQYGPGSGPGSGPGYGPGYGLFGGNHMMSPLGGGLFIVLFLVVVIVVLTRATRRSGGEPVDSALDILKKRYARGEITREEFTRMRQELKD